jgi:NADP-dependent aldehyde dehydrogenase
MKLEGIHLIGQSRRADASGTFRVYNPEEGEEVGPAYPEATEDVLGDAMTLAEDAFRNYRRVEPGRKAQFLRQTAEEILGLGDQLIDRAATETALSVGRLRGERSRTVRQLRLFAEVVDDGSWVDARIDTEPDVRRMLVPLGPVVVFGASNFPLAFSVAGGDTASALAAGCPVVFKAHPAHPGTAELVGRALRRAVDAAGLPEGVFSLVHGTGPEVGQRLVRHPLAEAVGFTGSHEAGRALFDAAMSRPEPIPVYAEMGSVNPVFVLPSALENRGPQIAEALAESILLGVGQYCTNPGLIVGREGKALAAFEAELADHIRSADPDSMLYPGLSEDFAEGARRLRDTPGVEVVAESSTIPASERSEGRPVVFRTDASHFAAADHLEDEVFGPSSLVVRAASDEELLGLARGLEGQLTATLRATEEELRDYDGLVQVLRRRVGRLIFNGVPTGVAVCPSMQHGGPYPATTDARSTSVGTAAIERFARPVAYQEFPEATLPPELRDRNERGIWRLVNGEWTQDDVS